MNEYIIRETGSPGVVKQEIVGELVRCKDCKHSRTEELTVKSKVGFLETRIIRFCNKNEMPIAVRADMHYCAWGERKDDADE